MRFLPQEIIRTKRDGGALSRRAIGEFVDGITAATVGEGQAAAFCMAVLLRGMTQEECVALTEAMARSGTTLAWDLPGPVLDKHSTGGVGDATSLPIAPIVAACGGFVPMISGRGLGHTGGTLDKLDSIPGYRSQPDLDALQRTVREVGCAIIGQTPDLAPADRRLYAIRDVTATVESIDLITASILSKKLAAGLDGLVMDVKFGSGAFMREPERAEALARRLTTVAGGAGLPTTALLTDMDSPLGSAAGNALEVSYAIDYLTGARREPRFHEAVTELAAEMLVQGRLAENVASARSSVQGVLDDGSAAERFDRMVASLGGPTDLVEAPARHLAEAPVVMPVVPAAPGRVAAIDTRAVGLVVVTLGGGRTAPGDAIDPAVGLTRLAAPGQEVGPDAPLALVHARSREEAEAAAVLLRRAFTIADDTSPPPSLVRSRIRS